ncbi:MAG: fumarate reductase (quinol) flavoprotein subunit, partial [Chloroflexota bacterium]
PRQAAQRSGNRLFVSRFAMEHDINNGASLLAQAEEEQRRIAARFFQPRAGKETIASVRVALNKTMEEGAGIYRTEESLWETCQVVEELKERYNEVTITDHSLSFNTELTMALELESMLDVAEAVAFSALQRKESRGGHQRTDYPQRDDQNFLKHSLAFRTDGAPRIEYLDVVITRWPPKERVYGRT